MKLKGIIKGSSILRMLAGSTDLNRVKPYISKTLFYKYSVSKDFKTQLIAFPEANWNDGNMITFSVGIVFLLKLDSNYEWVVYNEITSSKKVDFGLFGSSIELSQDGRVICIASNKTNEISNSVFIYDGEGHLKQEIVGLIDSSFGNTLILYKNKKQLLISSHEFSESSESAFIGKIEIFNLNNNKYELFQKLSIGSPYDHFGWFIMTNYNDDLSFNKLNKISTMGDHTGLSVFELYKDKWYLK